MLENQLKGDLAFIKKHDPLINKGLKFSKIKSRIIQVDTKENNKFLKNLSIFNPFILNQIWIFSTDWSINSSWTVNVLQSTG